MICESCKFDNREGALYCAECGRPLAAANKEAEKPEVNNEKDSNKTVILDEVVTNSKESVDSDDSEANTTVLTSDMLKPAQAAAPQSFTPGPAPMKPMSPNQAAPQAPKMAAPQQTPNGQPMPQAPKMAAPQQVAGGQPMPMAPQAPKMAAPQQVAGGQPMPQAPKMAAPQQAANSQPMPQAPKMAAPQQAPNGQPMPQAPKMAAPQQAANSQPMQQAPEGAQPLPLDLDKPAKADKKADKKAAKAAKKEKKSGGSKAYVVISIILMLAMAGGLVYGYFYHTKKMDAANTEIDNLKASNSDAQATISQKDNEIAKLYASSTDAQTTISTLETQLAESQAEQETAQATAATYVAYDPLISFVESSSADSNTDMLVSDTVVSTTVDSTVTIYVYFPSDEGHLNYLLSDSAKAECEWGEEWVNGNVLPLEIVAKEAGDITIEITNDQNDVSEEIFVHIR